MNKNLIYILILTGIWISAFARAEEVNQQDSSKNLGTFIQVQPLPFNFLVSAGLYEGSNKFGFFGSRGWGYRSLGLEYSYYFEEATTSGFYGKIFVQRRWYNAGLKVNSRYVDDSVNTAHWEEDTLNHHSANHYGALIGYQKVFGTSNFYMQASLGWQLNDNPVNTGSGMFGLGQDTKESAEATGEFGFGYNFK